MPPRRNKEKFQQLTEFERRRIIGLREGGLFYRVIGPRGQRNSSTVIRVWKQCTEQLAKLAVDDGRQLAARWSTATGVLMSASSIRRHLLHRGLRARMPLYRISFTLNHQRLRLQCSHNHRAWEADWYQVVFSDELRFNLWDHEGRIRIVRSAGELCLPECVIKRHSGLTPGVMVWGAISYHERSNLLRIEVATGTSVKLK
ncbi:transposable element Tc1 transposase [Trichonephila clavipes]|nr:transposable element Tc1 transposase [Trichonephila clavipes]